jgi:hypothetical protein
MQTHEPEAGLPTVHARGTPSQGNPVCAEVDSEGNGRLLAGRSFAAGDILFKLEGSLEDRPSRHSVQIGELLHVRPDSEGRPERVLWRYMNHSCEPSVAIRGIEVVALRSLEPGEEITFDYCTTEAMLISPFACACQAAACRKWIAGFLALTPEQRASLLPVAAPHLAALQASAPEERSAPPHD